MNKKLQRLKAFLKRFGITRVRVRHYDYTARIEVVKKEIPRILKEEARRKIIRRFRELGYSYVTVDLAGSRTGSMNPAN